MDSRDSKRRRDDPKEYDNLSSSRGEPRPERESRRDELRDSRDSSYSSRPERSERERAPREHVASDDKAPEPQDLDPRRLYVANLSERTREAELHAAFQKWGPVKEAKIIIDAITQRPRGYAFVTMQEAEDGVLAQKEADKTLELDGKVVTVETARGKDRPHGQGAQRGAYPYAAPYGAPAAQRRAPDSRYDYDPRDSRRDRAPYDAEYRRERLPPGRYDYPPPFPLLPEGYPYLPYPEDSRYAPYPRGREYRDPYAPRRDDREYSRMGLYPPPVPFAPLEDYYGRAPHPALDRHRDAPRPEWERGREKGERGADRSERRSDKDRSSNPSSVGWEHSRSDTDRKRPREDHPTYEREREEHRPRDGKRDERR